MEETKMSHNKTEDQLKAALLALKGAVRDRATAHLPEIAVQQSNGSWQISNAVPAPVRKALEHLISFGVSKDKSKKAAIKASGAGGRQ
jgi:hypothetical protein